MIDEVTPVIDITWEIAEWQQRQAAAHAEGVPALLRLVEVAQGDTGQSGVCGRFLLGVYNGAAYPFNLVDLRRLDYDLWQDCLAVLAMDRRPRQEVHQMVENGYDIWEGLKKAWATDRKRRARRAV